MVKKQLHPGAKWLFRIGGIVGIFFFVIFFSIFFIPGFVSSFQFNPDGLYFLVGILIFIFLLLLVWIEIYTRMAYNRWFYDFTDSQLRVEKGIIWKKYSNIPYQRVQNVDITRGVIARICGFSSVNIQTAGYSAPVNSNCRSSEGYIPAVDVKEAEKIREFLMKKISNKNSSGL
jgi:membrane protein YdbS with pleckstrin-like domain